jgi:hypothetical protein
VIVKSSCSKGYPERETVLLVKTDSSTAVKSNVVCTKATCKLCLSRVSDDWLVEISRTGKRTLTG